jgi:hypothetical protein
LVDSKDIDTLSSELENRLDALFGENDIQLPNVPEKKRKEAARQVADCVLAQLENNDSGKISEKGRCDKCRSN